MCRGKATGLGRTHARTQSNTRASRTRIRTHTMDFRPPETSSTHAGRVCRAIRSGSVGRPAPAGQRATAFGSGPTRLSPPCNNNDKAKKQSNNNVENNVFPNDVMTRRARLRAKNLSTVSYVQQGQRPYLFIFASDANAADVASLSRKNIKLARVMFEFRLIFFFFFNFSGRFSVWIMTEKWAREKNNSKYSAQQ